MKEAEEARDIRPFIKDLQPQHAAASVHMA